MSAPVKDDAANDDSNIVSIYAPPWTRDAATDAADAALGAATNLRRLLPVDLQSKDPEERARPPTLDPVAMPGPPSQGSRHAVFPFVAWIAAAAGAAAFVAMIAGVAAPEWLRGVDESAKAFGARMFGTSASPVAPKLADHGVVRVVSQPVPVPEQLQPGARIAAPAVVAAATATQLPVVTPRAAPPAPSAIAPPASSAEREEITALYKRGAQLVTQGEIAAARLVFARAAEAGDARAAFALGASYDPDVLKKLGVLGVVGDAALAREWYVKASALGSQEAAQRIELMARVP